MRTGKTVSFCGTVYAVRNDCIFLWTIVCVQERLNFSVEQCIRSGKTVVVCGTVYAVRKDYIIVRPGGQCGVPHPAPAQPLLRAQHPEDQHQREPGPHGRQEEDQQGGGGHRQLWHPSPQVQIS